MLGEGQAAPGFTLPELAGSRISLDTVLGGGRLLLAFFKVSCPTCQLTFPFLERVNTTLPVIGISQDTAGLTGAFNQQYGVTFRTLLDSREEGYAVSNAFRITHVPSQFVIEPDGSISHAWSGFSRADIERAAGKPVFRAGDRVPEFKPG